MCFLDNVSLMTTRLAWWAGGLVKGNKWKTVWTFKSRVLEYSGLMIPFWSTCLCALECMGLRRDTTLKSPAWMAQFLWSVNDGASCPRFKKKKKKSETLFMFSGHISTINYQLKARQLAFKFPDYLNTEVALQPRVSLCFSNGTSCLKGNVKNDK